MISNAFKVICRSISHLRTVAIRSMYAQPRHFHFSPFHLVDMYRRIVSADILSYPQLILIPLSSEDAQLNTLSNEPSITCLRAWRAEISKCILASPEGEPKDSRVMSSVYCMSQFRDAILDWNSDTRQILNVFVEYLSVWKTWSSENGMDGWGKKSGTYHIVTDDKQIIFEKISHFFENDFLKIMGPTLTIKLNFVEFVSISYQFSSV